MIILGIETSCDETAAAVLMNNHGRITILSNVIASSATLQAKYGGIIPEQAAREQLKSIIPVIEEALIQSNLYSPPSKIHLPCSTIHRPAIDAIAVTYGPGLIGSLLVGVETAKTLALLWKKPLIPVNHLLGHFYANWISQSSVVSHQSSDETKSLKADSKAMLKTDGYLPQFPCLGLLISGGHTDLVLFKSHDKYEYLGGTRDDAAGECFDKCARLLGLPYPGGPEISKLALQGDALRFKLPIPMLDSHDLDFSYSGLKTAVANIVHSSEFRVQNGKDKADLAAAIEKTIVKSLVDKVVKALQIHKVEQIMIAGGVAANQKLQKDLRFKINDLGIKINFHVPPPHLCTDNAAMIAAAGYFTKEITKPLKLQANPNLTL